MPVKQKLSVLVASYAYGGNGGIASEVPQVRQWFAQVLDAAIKDKDRIASLDELTISDTPITMSRNRTVIEARKMGIDVLVMIDSDMNPLLHQNDPGFRPFFQSSFDFLYNHYAKGPCCIGAPYCGPPSDRGENVYVFEWQNYGDRMNETPFTLEMVPRMMAARMAGIQEAAALPTGLIMFDMRCFDLTEPSKLTKSQVLDLLLEQKITKQQALNMLHDGWFYYEWKDQTGADKISTEDVTATRDISLAGCAALGYNPVYCNWDSPCGHWKPWCVSGKPPIHDPMRVAATFRTAVLDGRQADEVIVDAGYLRHKMAGLSCGPIIPLEPNYVVTNLESPDDESPST